MKQIDQAIKILRQGGVVAYPTHTSYGLAVDPSNEKAVKKLYRLKGRDFKKPVHVIAATLEEIKGLVKWGTVAQNLSEKFWPGPLTLVLPLKAKGKTWKLLSAGTKSLGVRLSDYPIVTEMLTAFGKPITATSANVSGQPNTYSVAEIKKQFKNQKYKPDFYLDGGKVEKLSPSSIIQIDFRHVTLIREGPIKYHRLIKFLK